MNQAVEERFFPIEPGTLGLANAEVLMDPSTGVKSVPVQSATHQAILGFLSQTILTPAQGQPPAAGAMAFVAVDQARARALGYPVTESALDFLQRTCVASCGMVVDVASAAPNYVDLVTTSDFNVIRLLAGAQGRYTFVDLRTGAAPGPTPEQRPPPPSIARRRTTGAAVAGALGGGLVGLLAGGVGGAVAGAAVGGIGGAILGSRKS